MIWKIMLHFRLSNGASYSIPNWSHLEVYIYYLELTSWALLTIYILMCTIYQHCRLGQLYSLDFHFRYWVIYWWYSVPLFSYFCYPSHNSAAIQFHVCSLGSFNFTWHTPHIFKIWFWKDLNKISTVERRIATCMRAVQQWILCYSVRFAWNVSSVDFFAL